MVPAGFSLRDPAGTKNYNNPDLPLRGTTQSRSYTARINKAIRLHIRTSSLAFYNILPENIMLALFAS